MNPERRTPMALLEAVERRFGLIEFDLAASHDNCVVNACWTEEDNALEQDWSELGLCWLHPPGDYERWLEKCRTETKQGARILALVPGGLTHPVSAYSFRLVPAPAWEDEAQEDKGPYWLLYFHAALWGSETWEWRK